MDVDRSTAADIGIILVLVLYGFAVIGTTPPMAIAAWLISGLLVLNYTFEPVGEFVEEHQRIFMVILLAILVLGVVLS